MPPETPYVPFSLMGQNSLAYNPYAFGVGNQGGNQQVVSPQSFYTSGANMGLPNTDAGSSWSQMGLPEKLGVVSQGLGAFSTLAGIYSGFKALKLQKDMFNFQKDAWNKNYNNQLRDYENELRDRWTARNAGAAARGRDFESMESWMAPRRLTGTYSAGNPGFGEQDPAAYQRKGG